MAIPGKGEKESDRVSRKGSKAVRLMKEINSEGTLSDNVLNLLDKASKRWNLIANIDRAAVQGLTIDEVQQVVYSQVIKAEDIPAIETEITDLYAQIFQVEAINKRIIYFILLHVYDQREKVLSEHYQKHFAMWLTDKLNVPQSTAYKDAKLVETLHEYPETIVHMTENKISNFLRKLRDICYAPNSIKDQLIKRLPELSLNQIAEEIAAAGGERNRASYEVTKIKRLRAMRKKNEVVFKSSDSELLDDMLWIGKNITKHDIKTLKEQFS